MTNLFLIPIFQKMKIYSSFLALGLEKKVLLQESTIVYYL